MSVREDSNKELLSFWLEFQDVVDCDGEDKYIAWNNRDIKIDGSIGGCGRS